MKICKNKNCPHGGKPQPESNFYKQKKGKDGLTSRCKDCYRLQGKEYYEKNSEIKKQKNKNYNKEHRDSLNQYYIKWGNSSANFDLYYDRLCKYEVCDRDEENSELLLVQCKYCSRMFIPTNSQVKFRLNGINGKDESEGNFYCSNACKYSCPIFHRKTWSKGFAPATSREVQPQLRKMVLERDNWFCQKCGKTKEENPELELHCHHIDPRSK